ncbi:hypothetical protein HDV00_009992 [Rhizophlyctis rosea]|nr:hypothetical protein HDV00_009992 [Rhizophlyctis rosea]
MADHGHNHEHHGHHGHGHHAPTAQPGEDLHDTNVRYFNEKAHMYDKLNGVQDVAQQTAKVFQDLITLDPSSTRCLDFACGTGNLAVFLAPHVKSILGVDVSDGMIENFNNKSKTLNLPNISAKNLNVKVDADFAAFQSQLEPFDLIYTQLALHHIPDAADIVSRLAKLLKPGTGKLAVVDFENTKDGNEFHGDHHHVAHQHGFAREEVEGWLKSAGLNVEFRSRAVMLRKQAMEEAAEFTGGKQKIGEFPIFVAVGSK